VFWSCYRGRQYLLGIIFFTAAHKDAEYNELFSFKQVMCQYHCFHQTAASKVKRIICGRTRIIVQVIYMHTKLAVIGILKDFLRKKAHN
jgi:hypothetical protein